MLVSLYTTFVKNILMEYSYVQKWRYGIRHRIKENETKGKTKEKTLCYEMKANVFKSECITVVVRDCITKNRTFWMCTLYTKFSKDSSVNFTPISCVCKHCCIGTATYIALPSEPQDGRWVLLLMQIRCTLFLRSSSTMTGVWSP
jgi:hypothetical protein